MKALLPLLLPLLWAGVSPGKVRLPLARDAIKAANKEVAAAILRAKSRAVAPAGSIPRELAGELPPDALNSILANAANLSGGKGPLTILPPRVVNPSDVGAYEKDPNLALQKTKTSHRRRHRSLNTPFMNPGPGYMDIGTNGFSPLSFAMMRPDAASMSPFVPRNTPPPPIRIQLQDPLQDNYKRLILTESEKKVNDMEVQHLQNTLKTVLGQLAEKFQASGSFLEDAIANIESKAKAAEEKRRSNAESVRNMEAQIEKMKSDLIHERTAKQIAKLIGGVVAGSKDTPTNPTATRHSETPQAEIPKKDAPQTLEAKQNEPSEVKELKDQPTNLTGEGPDKTDKNLENVPSKTLEVKKEEGKSDLKDETSKPLLRRHNKLGL